MHILIFPGKLINCFLSRNRSDEREESDQEREGGALTGVAQLVGHPPAKHKVTGSW